MPLHTHKVLFVQTILSSEDHAFTNTAYWEPDDEFDQNTPGKFDAIAASYMSTCNSFHEDFLDDDAEFVGVKVTYYNGAGLYWEGYSDDAAVEGSQLLQDPMPPGVAALIQRRTRNVGRQHHGRMFIPFISENLVAEGGAFEPGGGAGVTALKDYASFLGSDQTFDGVLFHARHYNRKDDALEVITQCRLMNRVAYRRDRMRRYLPRIAMP